MKTNEARTTNDENMTEAFDGAIHDEASADMGSNRRGDRVVRLDLTYTRGTAPIGTTMILTLDAAIALRNQLDGLFAAAGIDDGSGCPACGEHDHDKLIWIENGVDNEVECGTCGHHHRLTPGA